MNFDDLSPDLAIQQITYLPISEVNNLCTVNKKYHSYCTGSKYNNR